MAKRAVRVDFHGVGVGAGHAVHEPVGRVLRQPADVGGHRREPDRSERAAVQLKDDDALLLLAAGGARGRGDQRQKTYGGKGGGGSSHPG